MQNVTSDIVSVLRRLYHRTLPIQTRSKIRRLRLPTRQVSNLVKATNSPVLYRLAFGADTPKQIALLLEPIVKSRTLWNYDDVWHGYNFTITPNYSVLPAEGNPIGFSSKSLIEQVRHYQPTDQRPWLTNANRAAELLQPLVTSGRYRDAFDIWAAAGIHVTPLPASDALSDFLPNLFILGAAKCGTTTLHAYLDNMPAVCMSHPKEPFFFEAEYQLGLAHFQRQYFGHWQGEPIVGEARHRNLYLPYIPERIHETSPNAKLIVMVRNPIDRAYSHWWHWHSRGIELLNFEAAIAADHERIQAGYNVSTPAEIQIYQMALDQKAKGIYRTYLDSGYYDEQIARYLQFFPREQLKVIYFEDLVENPLSVLQDLEQFLGTRYYTSVNFEVLYRNAAARERQGIQRTTMNDGVRAWLLNHYHDHNDKLAHYTGRNLSNWS